MTGKKWFGQIRLRAFPVRVWIWGFGCALISSGASADGVTVPAPPPMAPVQALSVGGPPASPIPVPSPTQAPHTQAAGLHAELSATSAIDGGIVLVNVHGVPPGANLEAKFESTELAFYPLTVGGSFQAVLGVPFNHKPGPAQLDVVVAVTGEPAHALPLPFTITDGKYPSEKLKVAKRNTNPKKADVTRILRDIKVVGAVYHQLTREKMWKGPFTYPIQSSVTSIFGTKRVFNGKMQSFHQGLDLRAAIGTPIHASAGGIVALAEDLFFTGNTVLIDHGYGVFTLYAHMSKLDVKKGQRVASQEVLGLSGKTGRVSGPHLHWGAIIHKAKVNPKFLTEVMQ